MELRDYRLCYGIAGAAHGVHPSCSPLPSLHRVLLRPDTETVINDVEQMCAEQDWTNEDRLRVEQSLLVRSSSLFSSCAMLVLPLIFAVLLV